MFDWADIAELDGDAAADRLAQSRQRVIEAEAEQFLLAAHWADLHVPGFVADCRDQLPGTARAVPAGADGCPQIDEFAGAELGALLGRTTRSGEQLVADAVNVRHRHPLLWAGIRDGELRVWVATKVARRCAAAELTAEQAHWVDGQTTPYLSSLPLSRFFALVEARIIEADPVAAEERAEAARLHRFVRASGSDEDGMRTVVARAEAGDVVYLVAVLDRIAELLAEQGDEEPLGARRVTALRVLANPARALAMLTGAALAGGPAGSTSSPAGDASADASWMRDALGAAMPGSVETRDDLDDLDDDAADSVVEEIAALFPPGAVGAEPGGARGGERGGVEEHAHPALLREVLAALDGFDPRRLDPVTVVYVHLSEAAVASGTGVARVEQGGPVVLDQLRRWLADPVAHQRIRVRPVLDTRTVRPIDRYEFSRAMEEVAVVRNPFEVFPYGTLPSRDADDDHAVPFDHGRGGRDGPGRPPPGQTSLENNAQLSRKHHRLKTHGRWRLHQPEPGVYWWRTPHGHWLRVDAVGTHQHGRDAALDARFAAADAGRLDPAG